MKPGDRLAFYGLRVEKVTHYEAANRDGSTREVWRYAFLHIESGVRYVYSGVHLGVSVRVGEVVQYRASIKRLRDDFGFVRLARLKKLEPRAPLLL